MGGGAEGETGRFPLTFSSAHAAISAARGLRNMVSLTGASRRRATLIPQACPRARRGTQSSPDAQARARWPGYLRQPPSSPRRAGSPASPALHRPARIVEVVAESAAAKLGPAMQDTPPVFAVPSDYDDV